MPETHLTMAQQKFQEGKRRHENRTHLRSAQTPAVTGPCPE